MSFARRYVPLIALIGAGLAFVSAKQSFAGDVYVLGDSIGEDIGRVAKQKTLAKISVSIANHWIYRQLPNVPPSSTVVMSLGTNDADNTGGVGHLGKHIDAIVAAAKAADLKVYWLGPVCVRTGSDGRSATLDKILADKLATTSVTYVSMRKPALCDPSLHAHDGQHFRDAGSRLIWQEVARVAGLDGSQPKTADVASPDMAPKSDGPVAPKPASDVPVAPKPASDVPVALKPAPAASPLPASSPAGTLPHLAQQPKSPPPAGSVSPGSFVTGSIDRSPAASSSTVAHTSVPPQVSLEVVPLGMPHPTVARLPPPGPPSGSAQPAAQTPQMIETATVAPQITPVVAKTRIEVLRTNAAHAPPENKPAQSNTCFFGLFSC